MFHYFICYFLFDNDPGGLRVVCSIHSFRLSHSAQMNYMTCTCMSGHNGSMEGIWDRLLRAPKSVEREHPLMFIILY